MMKLSHLLRSRTAVSEKLLPGKVSDTRNALWTHSFSSQAVPAGNHSSRIRADYTIYKGKAALTIEPIMPKFSEGRYIDKKGCILLKFSPAIGERKYDFQKKQIFALSSTELGSLISLGPGKSCEFFHDPSMKSSNAGQIRKSLSVTPLSSDDNGYFFTLSVVNNILKTSERFSVPVSKAEYTVMHTAFTYILPYIMGWDQLSSQLSTSGHQNPVRQQPPPRQNPVRQQLPSSGHQNPVRQQEMRLSSDLEWDR